MIDAAMEAGLDERLDRIERKLDALLAALADEDAANEKARLGSLDEGPLDLASDWGQTL